jgi:hypothetical protein
MSAEIVEAVKTLGREKGISEEKLMGALEDALLSAYKKQPGAARYARVRMDRDSGDFIVEEFLLPEDLEDQLLDEAEEQATGALERRVDPETGEASCVSLTFRAPRPSDLSDPEGHMARITAALPGMDPTNARAVGCVARNAAMGGGVGAPGPLAATARRNARNSSPV